MIMHPRLAERAVTILKEKKAAEGTKEAEAYVKRLCAGADAAIWQELRDAQAAIAAKWDTNKT